MMNLKVNFLLLNKANIDLSGLPHIKLKSDHFIDFFQFIGFKDFGRIL